MKKLTTAQLVKIFAGDLLKLSEHPKYRKELEKQERKKKNEEVLRRMRNKEEPIPETPLEKKIFDKYNEVLKSPELGARNYEHETTSTTGSTTTGA